MHNRLSMDSTTNTATNNTITCDGHDDAGRHGWTDEQIAIIVRVRDRVCDLNGPKFLPSVFQTLEEGVPPPKAELKNPRLYAQMLHQPNPNQNSAFTFLGSWNTAKPPPPTTPYILPHVSPNLIDHWARELKESTDWSHDTRALWTKLQTMAEEVAKDQSESSRQGG
jgi:hypothetical protein